MSAIHLDGIPIPVGVYPDLTPVVMGDGLPVGAALSVLTIRPGDMTDLMTGLWLADAYAESGHMIETLVLPSLPGARQDRMNGEGDFLFTAKSIAREINLRNFDRVLCFDPHSMVMPGLIDRCIALPVTAPIDVPLTLAGFRPDVIVAPDAGAEKRAAAVAAELGVPMIQAWKTRDLTTGRLSGFGHQPLPDGVQNVLVVDDLCDGGGTFIGLAEELQKSGSLNLALYVSHGLFTKGLEVIFEHYAQVFTTDSTQVCALRAETFADDGRLTVIPITTSLERAFP